jgi:hypothetical protein
VAERISVTHAHSANRRNLERPLNERKAVLVDQLMAVDTAVLGDEAALNHIGSLIDAAYDLGRVDGTEHAFRLLDVFATRNAPADLQAIVHYYRANAWNNRSAHRGALQSFDWEHPELQEELLELRRAIRHVGYANIPDVLRLMIRTNLAGKLSTVGRAIEAIEQWDGVLLEEKRFAKAAGNRGLALEVYAQCLNDDSHVAALLSAAHASFRAAIAPGAMHEADKERVVALYKEHLVQIEAHIDVEAVQAMVARDFPLGQSPEEIAYRHWCLDERLFINPLNDIAALSIAATDVMGLPSIKENSPSYMPPPIIGFFNQMKQEFVSARYSLYEGLHVFDPHFSDRDVVLINTLDYPAYGLATERLRTAFRTAYSILDKIAFFLNAYAGFNHKKLNQVTFRRVWYENADPKNGLIAAIAQRPNLPMRGLFWLSKDFYEEEFKAVTEPDAEAMALVRNQLEHRYLQLHDMGSGHQDAETAQPGLRFSLGQDVFSKRTLRLFRYVRAALIYLCMSVRCEELARQSGGGAGLTMPMILDNWDYGCHAGQRVRAYHRRPLSPLVRKRCRTSLTP